MLTKENFNESHIRMLQKQSKKDPALLERAVFAFGLLEAIRRVEMPFIFKGGTCLILLLKHPMRLSTDIDIIVAPDTDVDTYISKASTIFPFKQCEEQVCIGRNSIEKRHFKFTCQSPITGKDIYILLDILFAENPYTKVVDCEIRMEVMKQMYDVRTLLDEFTDLLHPAALFLRKSILYMYRGYVICGGIFMQRTILRKRQWGCQSHVYGCMPVKETAL